VELVQLGQAALLRCLARHHGLRRTLAGGMTAKDVPLYPGRIAELREVGEQLPALHRRLAEVRQLVAGGSAGGREGTERYGKAQASGGGRLGLLQEHRRDVLRFGAAGRLLAAGEIQAVLPLDDAELLDAARPVTPAGEVKADAGKVRAREEAQVRAALKA